MASTNQNFIKWEEDTFTIQFTITDADVELNNHTAYWAVTPATASLAPVYIDNNSTAILIKTTQGDFSGQGGISYQSYNKFLIPIKNTETTGWAPGDYYHELTLADSLEANSVVVATGVFTIRYPLFPSNYR